MKMNSYGEDISFYILENRHRPLSLFLDAFIKYNPYTPAIAEFSIRSGKEGSFIGLGYRSNQDVNIILQMGINAESILATFIHTLFQIYNNIRMRAIKSI